MTDFYSLQSPRTPLLDGADVPFDDNTNSNYGFNTAEMVGRYFVDPDDDEVDLRLGVVIANTDLGRMALMKSRLWELGI